MSFAGSQDPGGNNKQGSVIFRPMDGPQLKPSTTTAKITAAIEFIERNVQSQPSIAAIAAVAGYSEYYFIRQFRRYTGITPKQYLEDLTLGKAKALLSGSASVETAAYESGLSGSARSHDHFVTLEAVTPGEHKHKGRDLVVRYGLHPGPFGNMFLAQTERGICALAFVDKDDLEEPIAIVLAQLPKAKLVTDQNSTRDTATRVFSASPSAGGLHLFVKGTNFQVQVWRALLNIGYGQSSTYGELASAIGRPRASRALGNAVGANPVSYLIPCHRVLRAGGALGNYRWGAERKAAMLAWESNNAKRAVPS